MNEGLQRAREAREANKALGIATERLSPAEKAAKRPTSLRLAINAKCYDCVGADADPGPKARVRDCAIKTCSLHPVRPWQKSDEETDVSE